MTQKALAEKLVRTYGTRDPFGIAKAMGFIIIKTPLKGIRGFYQEARRCRIIYLSIRALTASLWITVRRWSPAATKKRPTNLR